MSFCGIGLTGQPAYRTMGTSDVRLPLCRSCSLCYHHRALFTGQASSLCQTRFIETECEPIKLCYLYATLIYL